jgi:hypothetical protein
VIATAYEGAGAVRVEALSAGMRTFLKIVLSQDVQQERDAAM